MQPPVNYPLISKKYERYWWRLPDVNKSWILKIAQIIMTLDTAFHDLCYPIIFFILEPKADIEGQNRNSERTYKLSKEERTVLLVTEHPVVFGFFPVVFSVAICFSGGDAIPPAFPRCFLVEASFTKTAVMDSLEVVCKVVHVTLHPRKLLCSVYASRFLLVGTEHIWHTGELHEIQAYFLSRWQFFA